MATVHAPSSWTEGVASIPAQYRLEQPTMLDPLSDRSLARGVGRPHLLLIDPASSEYMYSCTTLLVPIIKTKFVVVQQRPVSLEYREVQDSLAHQIRGANGT